LTQLSRVLDLEPGDLLLTGTPGGVAMGVSPDWNARVKAGEFPNDHARNSAWIADQLKRPNYLKSGDRITSRIRTADGSIDLGGQELVVGA
jgi:2-keto-4-pentenoate hydratase/2-oxohepta-3-ene-1,7-dioic acid hydratase in catechol pathway